MRKTDSTFVAGLSLALLLLVVVWRLEADDPSLLVKSLTTGGMGLMAMLFAVSLERMITRIHNRPPDLLRDYFQG